jgi:hypothetical protein
MKYNNKSSTDTGEIVNLFADFFQTVYSNSKENIDYIKVKSLGETCYNCNILSLDEVFSGILSLENPSSTGPDGIPAQFLVPCVFGLCKPIHHLFNLSIGSGVVPELWKNSYLIPIHKSGDNQLQGH